MCRIIDKVTALITRPCQDGHDLLLFEHPHAGIQIPAGTVEVGETPEQAALREASEETGLTGLSVGQYLGCVEDRLPQDQRIITEPTHVYARPDPSSFDWAYLRRGIPVSLKQRADSFCQVTYEEWDRVPDPQYVTMGITGWVPQACLASVKRRHFFHLTFQGQSQARWTVFSDHHHFSLFWAPLNRLPKIVHPQDQWLALLPPELGPRG